jgi:hypothetical protein
MGTFLFLIHHHGRDVHDDHFRPLHHLREDREQVR